MGAEAGAAQGVRMIQTTFLDDPVVDAKQSRLPSATTKYADRGYLRPPSDLQP